MPKEAKPIQAEPIDVTKARHSSIPATTTNPVPSGVRVIGMGELGMAPRMSSRLLRPSPVRRPNKEDDPPLLRSAESAQGTFRVNHPAGGRAEPRSWSLTVETESGDAQRCR